MTASRQTDSGYVEVDGGRLYYEVSGTGHPLVLVHGMMFDHRLWDEQVAAFAEHFQVVRYDMRGFGKSAITRLGSDAADLATLVRALDLAPIYLMGLSMGAETAHTFTLEHPAQVAALIEVGSGAVGWEASAEFEQRWGVFFEAAYGGDYDRARQIFMDVWVDGTGQATPAMRERAREIMQDYTFSQFALETQQSAEQPAAADAAGSEGADADVEAAVLAPPRGPTPEEQLAEIRIPTLIIVGARDQPGALSSANALAAGIAGAQKVVIPDAAHIVPLEQPAAFTQVVLDFLLAVEKRDA